MAANHFGDSDNGAVFLLLEPQLQMMYSESAYKSDKNVTEIADNRRLGLVIGQDPKQTLLSALNYDHLIAKIFSLPSLFTDDPSKSFVSCANSRTQAEQ